MGVDKYVGEDALPKMQEDQNDIHKILNSNGISYTHHNESLLKASTIETKLAKKAIEVYHYLSNYNSLEGLTLVYRARNGERMRPRRSEEERMPKRNRTVTGLPRGNITTLMRLEKPSECIDSIK